jgi:hypothetical protein
MAESSVPSGGMYFRQLLNDDTACASYLLDCKSCPRFTVVDPHDEFVAALIQDLPPAPAHQAAILAANRAGRRRAAA